MRKIQGPLDTDVRYLPEKRTQWSIRYNTTDRNRIEIELDHEPTAAEIDLIMKNHISPI